MEFQVRTPHPAKQWIERAGVELWAVSQRLGFNYTYTSALLSGTFMPTDVTEIKLQGIIAECKEIIKRNEAQAKK